MHRTLTATIAGALTLTGTGAAAAWPFGDGETPTLAPLLDEVTPAVVNVSVVASAPQNPLLQNPELRRFFDLPDELPNRQGVGSGVIVDAEEGIILSNHHVVADAQEIVVVLSDRRQFDARVVGSDAATDIAVLDIDAEGLTALPFADSEKLRVGDFVVAIGNPFGLGQTVTSGIVSALGRTGINVDGYEDFIQTDASINPGNSGGALIDLEGGLMGVNTAIVSTTGGNVGIGFAVPSEMARAVMDRILEFGEVRRGQLGVLIQDVTPELAQALSLDVDDGAIIADVFEGSAAETAGLMPGDVIVAVDDETVRNAAELRNEIGFVEPGRSVQLAVVRDGERRTVESQVIASPESAEAAALSGGPASVLGGAEVRELGPDHPLYGDTEGVVVARVSPGSRAALSGLLPGDVVLAVNRRPVASVAELRRNLDEAAAGAVALTLLRDGQQLFLVMR